MGVDAGEGILVVVKPYGVGYGCCAGPWTAQKEEIISGMKEEEEEK